MAKAVSNAKAKATVFKLHSPKAKKVSLAGTFNGWDTGKHTAKKDTKGTWEVKTSLKPGKYEYKFFVDGSWVTDPSAPAVFNSFGTQNSLVEVK